MLDTLVTVFLSLGDVKVKRFVLNDKEKALKEQFLKRYKFDITSVSRVDKLAFEIMFL